jgi:hypothetical protein
MAPNAGLDGDKANGLALGPCKPGAPATCKHSLYVGGLLDGFIRRINNPEDDPRVQTVDVVAMTTDQRAGVLGRGINGSMGMIGDDLYPPENQGFTVVKGISACPTSGQVCPTIPPAGSAEATVYCTTTCTRPVDPANPPGGFGAFRDPAGAAVRPAAALPRQPLHRLADPVATGAKGGFIAKQATTNTANFSVSTAPTNEPAGTYTAQFFNGGPAMGVTTGTITYQNDPAPAGGPAQLVPPNHIIN